MIRVGICDDEKPCREQIKNLLERYFKEKGLQYDLWEYESGMDFLDRGEEINLLFLDIEMEGISGIDLKDYLQAEEEIRIIFVTGHGEGMPEAFGKNVYGFLEKPLNVQKLEKYLGRVLEGIEEDQVLVLKGVQGEMALRQKDIFYFVSEKKYSRMVGRQGESFCVMSLQQLEEMLGQNSFFRCHKSYLVNLGNISDANQSIRLKNGESIPVSRRKAKELKDAYLKYIIRKAR
mgnify:CR=1 FL=1